LVEVDLTRTDPDLIAHPLVRERFGAELEQQHPVAARAALQAAEARIRAIGQWGLWRELHEVGEEIGVAVAEECPLEAD
jgi:hypothetical protein